MTKKKTTRYETDKRRLFFSLKKKAQKIKKSNEQNKKGKGIKFKLDTHKEEQ